MTPIPFRRAAFVGGLVLLAACGEGTTAPASERLAALSAVEGWVVRHKGSWDLGVSSASPLERHEESPPCSAAPISGRVALRFVANNTDMLLFFRCPLDETASLDELRAAFDFVVLDRLPHGISSPGWRFAVYTKATSVSEGVTLTSPSPDRLVLDIDTPLYAVWGQSQRASCRPPVDGPGPEECYLRHQLRVPLHLRVTATVDASALR